MDKIALAKQFTMFNNGMLESLRELVEKTSNLTGNIVECGAYKGGCGMFLATMAEQYDFSPRNIYSFDTFEGMPGSYPNRIEGEFTDVNFEETLEASKNFKNLFLFKGLFQDTIPKYLETIKPISFLFLDCDLYDSYIFILNSLYKYIVPSGLVVMADYKTQNTGATLACDEFFTPTLIKEESGVFLVWKQ